MVAPMRKPLIIVLALAACTDLPDLDAVIPQSLRDAPYPTLTPIPIAPTTAGQEADVLQARAAALQARAARIRQIDIAALQYRPAFARPCVIFSK